MNNIHLPTSITAIPRIISSLHFTIHVWITCPPRLCCDYSHTSTPWLCQKKAACTGCMSLAGWHLNNAAAAAVCRGSAAAAHIHFLAGWLMPRLWLLFVLCASGEWCRLSAGAWIRTHGQSRRNTLLQTNSNAGLNNKIKKEAQLPNPITQIKS